MVLETARKRDTSADVTMETSMCKLFASEMCGRVAARCNCSVAVAVARQRGGQFYDVRLFRLYGEHQSDPPDQHRQTHHGRRV